LSSCVKDDCPHASLKSELAEFVAPDILFLFIIILLFNINIIIIIIIIINIIIIVFVITYCVVSSTFCILKYPYIFRFPYHRRLPRQSPLKTTGLVEDEYNESGMGKRLFPMYVK